MFTTTFFGCWKRKFVANERQLLHNEKFKFYLAPMICLSSANIQNLRFIEKLAYCEASIGLKIPACNGRDPQWPLLSNFRICSSPGTGNKDIGL